MSSSRVGAVVLRILYLYRGSPQRVFPIFVFVAVDIILWGFLTRYLNSVSRADFNFVPALLGAVLLWDFLTRVMQQLTMALFEDVWSRNFLNFFAAPLRTSEYLTGLLIISIITSLASLIAMLAFAQLAFGRTWQRDESELRESIGISLQETRLSEKLTVRETLQLFSSFYRHPTSVDAVIEEMSLEEKVDARVGKLSGGQKQRLAVATALVAEVANRFGKSAGTSP